MKVSNTGVSDIAFFVISFDSLEIAYHELFSWFAHCTIFLIKYVSWKWLLYIVKCMWCLTVLVTSAVFMSVFTVALEAVRVHANFKPYAQLKPTKQIKKQLFVLA